MNEVFESKTCSRCGGIMESGRLSSPGEIAVRWIGPKTGIFSAKSARIFALRCPKCGLIQLESNPDQE